MERIPLCGRCGSSQHPAADKLIRLQQLFPITASSTAEIGTSHIWPGLKTCMRKTHICTINKRLQNESLEFEEQKSTLTKRELQPKQEIAARFASRCRDNLSCKEW